jgi:hypothetical protein
MKKLALLTAVLLLFGLTAGFAEATVDVSGSAEVTFGYNLDDGGAGFENSEDIAFVVTFVPESTVASDMMDGWHGWIEFADFSVEYDQDGVIRYAPFVTQDIIGEDTNDDQIADTFTDYNNLPVILVTEPDVTAKITNGTIWVKIYNDPAFDGVDVVEPIEDDTDVTSPGGDWAAEDEEAEDDIDQNLTEGGGITIGYDSDMIDVEVYVADYDGYSDAADVSDDWIFGAKVAVSASGADLTVEVGKGIEGTNVVATDDDELNVAASASYTLDAGMMTVVPYVGIDGYQTTAVDFVFEFAGGVDVTFTNDDTVGVHTFYSGRDFGGEMSEGFDVELVVAEDAEAGFVPGLGVDVMFGYYDLGGTGDADMLLNLDAEYMLGDIVPFVGFDYDALGGADAIMKVDAGVKYTGIPMTTILAQWNSGDLGASPDPLLGSIEFQAEVEM